ncbi:hypothetical protein [Polaribacter sp. AHE13PA]|uniref:hypothetical protein n=1 Tax=Polaribacter sp. AHE13PA TaxID=2745562 RepID=UPI001C4E62BB|nr:hypothetical protein [Polaribacter sp. AHE13PA]QXP65720.1 hypothetical protein H0I28_10925 [Polaribacter sp. AHE13PA]
MVIFKPKRRVCKGKEVRFEITELDPFIWLQVNSESHVSYSIDGFIIDSQKKINGIFNKYEYELGTTLDVLFETLTQTFSQEIYACASFASILNTEYRIFIWPKDFPENFNIQDKLIISIKPVIKDKSIDLSSYKLVNMSALESGIKKLRGYSFSNVKSLLSANSNVECFLANNTGNPWPGDLDALIYLKSENKTIALIEFKTHNKNTPISDEYIGKYGKQDWRRFEVLYNLQNQLELAQNHKPKIFYVVWGTKDFDNHKMIKIDIISNNKVESTNYLDRPAFGESSMELFNLLLKLC